LIRFVCNKRITINAHIKENQPQGKQRSKQNL
jgi:hypothetical protein